MNDLGLDTGTLTTLLSGGSAIGSLIGFATLWFRLRNMLREDNKAKIVDESWKGLVAELRAEIDFLKAEVKDLRSKIEDCEAARESLIKKVTVAMNKTSKTKAKLKPVK